MTDPFRTNHELIEENSFLKQRIQELEHSEAERKQVEDVLRKSEEKYRLIAEKTADLISILDMNLRFTYISPATMRLRGFTVEEAMAQPLNQVLTPDSMRLGLTIFEEEMQLEASGTADPDRTRLLELEEYKKDGSIIWVEVSLSFLRDKDGHLIEILMVSRDITDRKQMEKALRESEARFRNILQDIESVAVQGYGPDGITLYWNIASERLYGYNAKEAIGRNLVDLIIPPEMREGVEKAIQLMAETGVPIPASELSLMRKDGSRVAVFSSHTIVQVPGRPQELFCIDIDLTERKVAEKIQSDLIEKNPMSIQIVDKEGFTLKVNPAHTLLFGPAPPPDFSIFADLQNKGFGEFILLAKKGEVAYFPDIYFNVHDIYSELPDKPVWIRAVLFPLEDIDGNPERFVFMHEDITARKQAEEALRESEEGYRNLFENANEVIVVVQDGKLVFVNPMAIRLMNYTEKNLIPKSFIEFIHPDDQGMIIDRYARRIKGEEVPHIYPFRIIREDGKVIWVELNAVIINWKGKQATLNFLSDITERKHAEETLRETESRFRAFVEQSPVAIGVFSLDGITLYTNHKFVETLGFQRSEEVVGRPAIEYFTPQFRDESKERTRRRLAGLPVPSEYESAFLRADGVEFPVHVAVAPIQLSGRTVSIAFVTDITERKHTEAVVRESEEKYRSILENIDELYFELDLKGNITFFNDSVCSVSGYAPSEAMGMNYRQYTSPETAKQVKALFGNIYLSGENSSISDFDFIDKDKSIHTLELSVKLLKNSAGEAVGFRCIARDITDRKRMEDEKRRTEQRYRTLFSRASDGIFIMTTEGKLIEVNEAFARMHGYSVEEMLQMNLKDFDTAETSQMAPDRIRRLIAGESLTFEVEHYHKDGHVFPLEVSASVISSREESYIQCFHRDITERKQAGEALGVSEQKYRLLAENSVAAIWTINLEGVFTYMSSAIEKLLSYRVDEVMEMQVPGIIVKEDYDNLMMILAAELAKPQVERLLYYRQQIRCKRKDGSLLDVEINVTWLNDDQGNVIGLQGSTSDITERKKAEEEKIKLYGQLLQSQKMESVGRLAGGVAHDFNNMLGLILGHAELALEHADPTHPLHTDLQEIRKAAERSADLTRQLLAFARQQTVELKVLDLNKTITDMLKMLQRLIGEDIDLKWESKANLWSVKMDPTQINQILANLCINARDAIAGVGKLTIETGNIILNEAYCADHAGFMPGEYVTLIVSDDGCGMDEETIGKIFEPFFTTKETGKGTGLGLATVYGIVKQNNGFINVYSEPGQGTTFTIYLPRYVGKAELAQLEDKQRPALRGQETILLVEDEPDILNLTTILLERQGYTVLSANTPGKAISLAGEHIGQIHLLMTDVVMPEMNGRDLAKTLLDLYPHLKRLFTSGYTADVIAHHGVLDEGVHFIQKPFSIKALAAKVREVLDQK